MKNKTIFTTFVLALIFALLVSCEPPASAPLATEKAVQPVQTTQPTQTTQSALANPASENCIKQGGTLTIEQRGDQGQLGVCYFEDNQQCEEWALMRGECPVGGVKVTGYVTPAGRYCGITGGEYAVTGNSGAADEQGTCTFKDGSQCDAWDYYNGKCTPQPAEATPSPTVPAVAWNAYANPKVGFTIKVPSTWNQQTLPDQNEGAIHGEGFSGTEGGVEVYWGLGFGGACPAGTEPVQLAAGEVPACHTSQSDGTEAWEQIGYQVEGGNSFSVRAYTGDSQPSSHDLVLKALSTLVLRTPAKLAIQPLTMEVCDGQAQAMAHALDLVEVTQSEELLDDYVNEAYGTGCQALATGTGEKFESPDAVVNSLGSMLVEQGWTQDPNLAAGGPGVAMGYRKSDQICWASAGWTPDASANCPTDQPYSACDVKPEQQNYTVALNCGVEGPLGEASADGSALINLTNNPAEDWAPTWSPDGSQIAFQSNRDGNFEIYRMAADGSNPVNLTNDPGDDQMPYWRP